MKRTQHFTIGGDRYEFGPITLGTLAWIKQKFKTVEAWNRAIGLDRDPTAIAETVHKILSAEGKAKFKQPLDLLDVMPGDLNYLTILFLRIMSLYGQTYGEIVDSIDMENPSEDDLKNLHATLSERAAAIAPEKVAETNPPGNVAASEAQTPTT